MNLHPMELRGAVGAMTLAALLSAQAAGQTTNDAARSTANERPDGLIELPGQGDGGDVPILAATYADDEVPLPIPAEYVAGPQGDTLAAPASGDPHFLGFVAGRHYPPADETVDPLLLAQLQSQYLDGRPGG